MLGLNTSNLFTKLLLQEVSNNNNNNNKNTYVLTENLTLDIIILLQHVFT